MGLIAGVPKGVGVPKVGVPNVGVPNVGVPKVGVPGVPGAPTLGVPIGAPGSTHTGASVTGMPHGMPGLSARMVPAVTPLGQAYVAFGPAFGL